MITKIVCIQLTKCIEDNNLLPKSQHGFRKMRSTMTAHSNMQQQWINNQYCLTLNGLLSFIWENTKSLK